MRDPAGRVGQQIRGTHPYCFRSGEWGMVQALLSDPESGRLLYLVEFPDRFTDFWVVDDLVAGYQFQASGV